MADRLENQKMAASSELKNSLAPVKTKLPMLPPLIHKYRKLINRHFIAYCNLKSNSSECDRDVYSAESEIMSYS